MIQVWTDLRPRTGSEQMALDRALLDHANEHNSVVLRLYRWSQDTISFGANESALRHWDRQALESEGVPLVRRPTGGRAVWHAAEDLTYAVTAPVAHFGNQQIAYRAIHERLAAALENIGLATGLAVPPPRLPGLQAGACFDVAVGGEVLLGGRKTIGSAQLVLGHAILQHGEIARAERLGALARFARDHRKSPAVERETDLPAADVLADAIAKAWYAEGAIPAGDNLMAAANTAALGYHAHFRDLHWTWRR
jgi:lipoate-protein ligase A